MSNTDKVPLSRRQFLIASAGFAALAGAGVNLNAAPDPDAGTNAPGTNAPAPANAPNGVEPFYGKHQGGILTTPQSNLYFAALDLVTTDREDIVGMLKAWTSAAAAMTRGQPAKPMSEDKSVPAGDSGDVIGLAPARLTVTFGFGAGLFIKDGQDRYGLAAKRPEALVDMPKFAGDQMVEGQTGGDLMIQACADDPQVAFHAVRQLVRLAYDAAQIRWVQSAFLGGFPGKETPRNLMGFKDGTNNPSTSDLKLMDKIVWVGEEGPAWMKDGTYMVARRTRIALEHWDRMNVDFQEQTMGRHKDSGAPLGRKREFDEANFDATNQAGDPVIPENAHIHLAAAANNDGAQILRRSYSYNDGVNFTTERWPPWKQGMEYDAGLFFECFQRDPRTGFIKIFERMSKLDMMNQFVTPVGGAFFACPGGAAEGEFIGQRLFDKA